MKNNILAFISFLVMVCAIVIGVSVLKNNKETPKEEKKDSKAFVIRLDSNPSTGYHWDYMLKDGIVSIKKDYETSCAEDLDGCPGTNIYYLTPLEAGKTTFTLEYRSPSNELETYAVYEIIVDKELNISESHKGPYFETNEKVELSILEVENIEEKYYSFDILDRKVYYEKSNMNLIYNDIELEKAINNNNITMEYLYSKASSIDGLDDGGSTIYRYDDFSIVACNNLNGNTDIIIGSSENLLDFCK